MVEIQLNYLLYASTGQYVHIISQILTKVATIVVFACGPWAMDYKMLLSGANVIIWDEIVGSPEHVIKLL